ncbi:MAG: ATP-binding cassette domain-containing protein [Actinomycetota bacterium]
MTTKTICATMSGMNDPAIAVEGLVKRYGSLEALAGIDFQVPAGTVFGLLGPNGAGKTTAVRILSTIIKPDAGRAEVLGYDVQRNPQAVRRLIGLAGQYAAVDPNLTGRENLLLVGKLAQLPGKYTKARAGELLELFDLVKAADRPIKTYSGGMRRRLDVAAALVGKPPVIFLDEPTTGLDIQSRTELWQVIRELVGEGSTVLLTTQYLEEADVLADRIAVVNAGELVANDTAANLKSRLSASVVEVTLPGETQAVRAQALLAGLVQGAPEREGSRLRLTTPDAPTVLTKVLRALDSAGMHPVGITVHDPSLDDVFLALTGTRSGNNQAGAAGSSTTPIAQAAGATAAWIDTSQDVEPEPRGGDEALVFEDNGPAGAATALDQVLAALPYKAGSGEVNAHLLEVARALQAYYRSGNGNHVDTAPLSGYLTLEQRFGRINGSFPPEQVTALLMGAARASGSGLTRDERMNGRPGDFAEAAVKILLEGICEPGARGRR